MPIAFSNRAIGGGSYGASPRTYTLGTSPTSGNRLIVSANAGSRNVTDVYDNVSGAGTWTQLYSFSNVWGDGQQIWLSPVLTGTMPTSISVAFDGTGSFGTECEYAEVSGTHATTPEGVNAVSTTGYGTTETITISTSNDNEGLFVAVSFQGSTDLTISAPTSSTEAATGAEDYNIFTNDDLGSSGSKDVTITFPINHCVMGVVTLIAAAAGGSSTDLVIQDAAHGHAADGQTLTSASQLAIADATHGHAADAPTLSTQWLLTIADATHGHAADGLGLTLATALAVSDAAHGHAADNLGLTLDTHLVIAEAGHAHTADALGLTTEWLLTVADATHAHTADNVTLNTADTVNLLVADATHGHAADSLGLTSDSLLVVADALHAHAAESPALSTEWLLTIADALHAHAAENLTVTADNATNLIIAEATHAHAAESIGLTLDTFLAIAAAAHAHSADALVLNLGSVALVIADASHAHLADNPTLALLTSGDAETLWRAVLESRSQTATLGSRTFTATLGSRTHTVIYNKPRT